MEIAVLQGITDASLPMCAMVEQVQETMVYMMCAGAIYFVIAAVMTVYQSMHNQDIGFLW